MRKPYFLIAPIYILIITIASIAGAIWVSIYSSLEFDERLDLAIQQLSRSNKILEEGYSWTPFIFLIFLFIITIVGLSLIFVYYQKSQNLYRLQENFISNFTHELKTPVASIKLYLETFKKRDLKRDQQLEFIDFMLRDTDRLHKNIEQILQTSKVEGKKEVFEMEDLEINSFIKEFLERSRHLFNGIVSFESKESQSIYSRVNKELFESALLNLISNGLKYNDSNSPEVVIKIEASYGTYKIIIADNGIGIDKKNLRKVFKKFYRVSNKQKGTGLGLYLVKQIVEIHKGKIDVESGKEGTQFIIELTRFYPANPLQFKSSKKRESL